MKKEHIQLFLTLLSTLAGCVLVMGNFVIAKHITLPLIALAVLGGCGILSFIIERKIQFSFDWKILLCLWAIFGVYNAACLFNNESSETTMYLLTFKSIILGYSVIVFISNWKDKRSYYAVFMTFILTNFVLAGITVYNYIDLIYVHDAQGMHPSWVNFMDMMYDKIIPYGMYHHLLSVFTVFSIYLCYLCLSNKVYLFGKAEKYLVIFLLIFLVSFLHFLSARIGLLLFYIGLIVLSIYIIKKEKFKIGYIASGIAAFVLLLSTIYTLVPTIHIKAQLTFNEISYYFHSDYDQIANGPDYRLRSYISAIEEIKKAPLHGIGFDKIGEKLKGKMPHNVYLFYGVFFGLPLAFSVFILTYLPLFFVKRPIGISILVLYTIHTLYSFTDVSLEIKTYFYFISFWLPFMIGYHQAIDKNIISSKS